MRDLLNPLLLILLGIPSRRAVKYSLLFVALAAAPTASYAQRAVLVVSANTIGLGSNNQAQQVQVTSSLGTSAPLRFAVGVTYTSGQAGWFNVLNGQGTSAVGGAFTTPATIYIQLAIANPGNGTTGSITLTDLTDTADSQTITVNYAPESLSLSLVSLNPVSATAAGPAFTLTINGTGFLSGSTVLWNGTPLPTTFVSSTRLDGAVSVDLIWLNGSASVSVQNPGGGTSNALTFTVNPLIPSIQEITPASAAAGSPGFNLAVAGTGFLFGATVEWNGSPLSTALALGSAGILSAQVPASLVAAQGTATVTVVNQGRASYPSNGVVFAISQPLPGPQITGFNPGSAVAGGPSFTLTVAGSGFANGAVVEWSGSALPTTFVNANQLTASVPADFISVQGPRTIVVVNPGGATSTPATFTVAVTSMISSLSPNSATAGGAGFTLTVNGSGFLAGSVVEWNGSALATNYFSASQLSASVPASLIAAAGSASLTVVDPGGATSSAVSFTVNPPAPSISILSPTSATAGGAGFTLTVNGSGFLAGSVVEWNGSALATNYLSATQLTASAPASLIAAQGNENVTVLNPGGLVSPAVPFNVTEPSLSIVTASPLPAGTVGVSYSQALSATGGVTPYKGWSVIAGSLPPGTSLSSLGGVLSGLLEGVPTAPGVFTFTVEVTDNVNATATRQFSLTIGGVIPTISANGIANAASYAGGRVAPGEMVVIYGSGLGPGTLVGLQLNSRGYVSTSLGGTQVIFDGIAAPLVYAEAGAVSAVVPYEVSGKSSTQVQVVYQGQNSAAVAMPVTSTMPGVFTDAASGQGQGAVVNQDGTVNSTGNPAAAGSIVFFYATGEGQTTPAGVDGQPDGSPAPMPTAQPVTVTIGGANAVVLYAGGVPGLVAGVLQVNVQLPGGIVGNAVPIVVTIGGKASQTGVTLAIR